MKQTKLTFSKKKLEVTKQEVMKKEEKKEEKINKEKEKEKQSATKIVQPNLDTNQKILKSETIRQANSSEEIKKNLREIGKEEAKFEVVKKAESVIKVKLNVIDTSKLNKISSKNYHIIEDAPFYSEEPVPLSFLIDALKEVETFKGENSKDAIKEVFSNLFRSIAVLTPSNLLDAIYFLITKIEYQDKYTETGIGEELIIKAISQATGRTEKQIRATKTEKGDLGEAACDSKSNIRLMDSFLKIPQTTKKLTLTEVIKTFLDVIAINGHIEKINKITKLLTIADKFETKFIARWLEGNLKIGAAEKTILSALARAVIITPFNQKNPPNIIDRRKKMSSKDYESRIVQFDKDLNKAISFCPSYKKLIKGLFDYGDDSEKLLEFCNISIGIAVKPMLAKPTKGVKIIMERFNKIPFTCEFKYDGFRGQIHFARNKFVKIFSRNLEEMSDNYPDVIELFPSCLQNDVENCIIDSEFVPFDIKTRKKLPFQEISKRKRKDVVKSEIEIFVCVYAFDMIYINNKSLVSETMDIRRELLHKNVIQNEEKIEFVQFKSYDPKTDEDVENAVQSIQQFLEESIKSQCEGLMVKAIKKNSEYQPAKRTFNWLKLKKDYLDTEIGDSIDLAVIGGDFGMGKRKGVYGSFLLASYDKDTGMLKTACKIGTGFSDENLELFYQQLHPLEKSEPPSNLIYKEKNVNVWFEPKYVWEMKAADLSLSPVYTAGLGTFKEEYGIGLRFPRFLRVREDKKPNESTNCDQLISLYKSQASVAFSFEDDDYY